MEGPTVRVIADKMAKFGGKKVINASGNSKIEKECMEGRIITKDDVDKLYLEEFDITSCRWNHNKVIGVALQERQKPICDVLLDQGMFAGVANIIKNEGLFRGQIHPLRMVKGIPHEEFRRLVLKTREYSPLFYGVLKKGGKLNSHLRIYRKRQCPLCQGKVVVKKTGESKE